MPEGPCTSTRSASVSMRSTARHQQLLIRSLYGVHVCEFPIRLLVAVENTLTLCSYSQRNRSSCSTHSLKPRLSSPEPLPPSARQPDSAAAARRRLRNIPPASPHGGDGDDDGRGPSCTAAAPSRGGPGAGAGASLVATGRVCGRQAEALRPAPAPNGRREQPDVNPHGASGHAGEPPFERARRCQGCSVGTVWAVCCHC